MGLAFVLYLCFPLCYMVMFDVVFCQGGLCCVQNHAGGVFDIMLFYSHAAGQENDVLLLLPYVLIISYIPGAPGVSFSFKLVPGIQGPCQALVVGVDRLLFGPFRLTKSTF